VSLPRFFSRVSNALGGVFGPGLHNDLAARLSEVAVTLEAPTEIQDNPSHVEGFVLSANLLARIYPRIRVLAPARIADEACSVIESINPKCDIARNPGPATAGLAWGFTTRRGPEWVTASARGWNVLLDTNETGSLPPASALTTMAAASLGVSEVFRTIFASQLGPNRSRTSAAPRTLNLLTLDTSRTAAPDLPEHIDLGRIHLAGAGAIGQAAIYALARSGGRGTLVVVDPEDLALSNLQRYVLATDADVGQQKCALAERALRNSGLSAERIPAKWGEDPRTIEGVRVVMVAVDSSETRIAIQASLPRAAYNAWTQPEDLGWSRHERFGEDPCLACLYWPSGATPNQHELIARALRQPSLRVLAYLTHGLPVDAPLKQEHIPNLAGQPIPETAPAWLTHSLLDDIGQDLGVPAIELAPWRGRRVSDLYHEGVCGGAFVPTRVGEIPGDAVVPLAHQSAFAGIMLAAQVLIANVPSLAAARSRFIEGRVDVLRGLPESVGKPRQRTRGCLCSDHDFRTRYQEIWSR
jgi:hypothetical protein